MPALVRLCDRAGVAVYFNRRWLELTGVVAPSQLGLGWLELVHPQDRQGALAPIAPGASRLLGLKLDTIAEGVETTAQLDFLRSIGCGKMQGYLFSRPLPLDAFAALLRSHVPQASGAG